MSRSSQSYTLEQQKISICSPSWHNIHLPRLHTRPKPTDAPPLPCERTDLMSEAFLNEQLIKICRFQLGGSPGSMWV